MTEPDFIPAAKICELQCYAKKSLYHQFQTGEWPLAAILVKVGGRLGCWRTDYEQWLAAQRKLPCEQRGGA